ncbi:Hypothetical predicted protein [Paramuricea clavata]|uniref:Uncharacterized protein n=1 Tax=Paramuricea clavata TaxID=317549 RepID=A0A6S7I7P7_PARCT|nr:Hypothetical predicted protein [Paramuricea clavata]
MRNRSCVTQLLPVLHSIGKSLDRNTQTDMLYFDFAKAFDSVDHVILIQKLKCQDEFDRRINEILAGIPHVKSNRDDCLIGGKDRNEHNRTLDLVLTRLQDHGLTLRLEKCEFGKEEAEFYGVRFTGEGIKPSKAKVKALQECGEPSSKEGVRSFLQMVGYMSRFITSFAQIAAPLRQLTKSTSTFNWGPIEQEAFDSLKSSLTEQTTLSYFVPETPIRIYVDAGKKTEKSSNVPGGLCAILCQKGDDGQWKMCHVTNRALTDVETRYGQTELEAAAIKFACADALYKYLVGAPKFEIFTDCKPLVHLFNNPTSRASLRIERQILAIQGLDYVVKYQKGAENIADYGSRHLTRRHDAVPMVKSVNELEEGLRTFVSEDNEYLSRMAKDDNDYQFLKEVIQRNLWKKHGKDPRVSRFLGVASDLSVVGEINLCKDKVIPPLSSRRRFVEKAHKSGHSGETRTLKLLQEKIWFPGIAKLCKEAVQNCSSHKCLSYLLEDSSSTKEVAITDVPLIGGSLESKGISKEAVSIIVQAWRPGTQKQYKYYLQKWEQHCCERSINPTGNQIYGRSICK